MSDQPNDAVPAPDAAGASDDAKKKQGTDWWAELKAIFGGLAASVREMKARMAAAR